MVKPICKDVLFLSKKSEPADPEDLPVCADLMETVAAHPNCVGMAANMIGVNKRIIVVETKDGLLLMINPVIKEKSGPYQTMEACLSLDGEHSALRYKKITVEYQDARFKKRIKRFADLDAQIVQHEMDHLEGILI